MSAHVKSEPGTAGQIGGGAAAGQNGGSRPSLIKTDPDAGSSPTGSHLDEDIYEDAGDLDFSNSNQSIYLTRLPKYLWEAWSQLDDDQEITIGRVRVEGGGGGAAQSQQGQAVQSGEVKRMSLMLDASLPKNRAVPKEYNLHITNRDSANTYVFSEKDLPGFGSGSAGGSGGKAGSTERMPAHWLNRKRMERKKLQNQQQYGHGKTPSDAGSSFSQQQRNQPYVRKAVPKQTALTGQVRTEINCLPVENDEYHRITDQRALLALRPRMRTKILDDVSSGSILNPGTMGASGTDFRDFINKAGPLKRKGQVLKTTRMPQNELIDLIYDCFKEYTYWPFKVMKDRVQQPEQYLRQTLEMIAFQAKSGTHMMEWQLKPEAKIGTYADAGAFESAKDEVAPDEGDMGMDGIDEEDDDDNVDMEDVI